MESEFTTKSRSDDHLQFDLKYVLWMFISTLIIIIFIIAGRTLLSLKYLDYGGGQKMPRCGMAPTQNPGVFIPET